MKKQFMVVFIVMAVFAAIFSAYAAAPTSAVQHTPGEINYQGKLVKMDGNSVTDGTYTLEVRFYREPTGAASAAIWGARYATYVKGGYFNLMLGGAAGTAVSGTLPTYAYNALWRALWPDSATPSGQKNSLYLGVTPISGVGTDLIWGTELSPRQNLLAAPYAFRAQTAEYANQSYAGFTVGGPLLAGYDAANPTAIAFKTYKSSGTAYLDIGLLGFGETKLQSAVTRVSSGQLVVSSATQSFTAGAGNFTVNSGTGNIAMSGKDATMTMGGNVTISGQGNLGTVLGSTSKPLRLMGSSIDGRGPVLWNKPSAPIVGERPFIVIDFQFNLQSGTTSISIDVEDPIGNKYPVGDYSAMVVGWNATAGFTTHALQAMFYDAAGNWKLRVTRSPSSGVCSYTVTVLFINKHMVSDLRTLTGQG